MPLIYYKSEFLNELEAVWNMVSVGFKPNDKYIIKQGLPVYDASSTYLFDMQQDTTVKIRYDLGPQWHFLNGWRRARMVEMYEIKLDGTIPRIFRTRYSDLNKVSV